MIYAVITSNIKHTNTLNNDSEPIRPINDTNMSNTITIKTFIPSILDILIIFEIIIDLLKT